VLFCNFQQPFEQLSYIHTHVFFLSEPELIFYNLLGFMIASCL